MIRVGFIGTGNIAETHARRLSNVKDAEIIALSDPNEQSRRKFKANISVESVVEFNDYREMLDQHILDAVIICTPHTMHFQQAVDAINAGLHVLVEKPMTCSSAEARVLIALAQRSRRILQVSFQRHYLPQFMYIRSAIKEGEIGRLSSVTATLYQDWKLAQEGTWRQNPRLSGGGMLMDSGSHIIDVLLWTTELTPESVSVELSKQNVAVEVDTFTAIRFAEGTVGSLNIIGQSPAGYFHETYAFMGDKGGILYDNGKITLIKNGEQAIAPVLPNVETDPDRSFIDAIAGRNEVLVPGEYGLKVVQLTEQIYEAAGYTP